MGFPERGDVYLDKNCQSLLWVFQKIHAVLFPKMATHVYEKDDVAQK